MYAPAPQAGRSGSVLSTVSKRAHPRGRAIPDVPPPGPRLQVMPNYLHAPRHEPPAPGQLA